MLCVRDKSCKYDVSKKIFKSLFTRVREAHPTHGAGEVVLVIEALSGLHGAVRDVLGADGAHHGAHADNDDDQVWSSGQASTDNIRGHLPLSGQG